MTVRGGRTDDKGRKINASKPGAIRKRVFHNNYYRCYVRAVPRSPSRNQSQFDQHTLPKIITLDLRDLTTSDSLKIINDDSSIKTGIVSRRSLCPAPGEPVLFVCFCIFTPFAQPRQVKVLKKKKKKILQSTAISAGFPLRRVRFPFTHRNNGRVCFQDDV